ncbi:MAG: VWA domain-containing protein [Anaerolineales bacterium]
MRFFDDWNTRRRLRTTGQALILIVLTFMGLLLFLGLMVDLGQIFLAKGYLRRAADAGALAAAAQFRESRTIGEMTAAALEVAHINGIDPTTLSVQTCKEGNPGPDATLCPDTGDMPRKKVRVTIEIDYPLTFLALLDIYSVHLVETSVSEAAAMDVVLVIDVSESMTWDNPPNGTLTYDEDPANPHYCNQSNTCEPFAHVKAAAADFAGKILDRPLAADEEDRLAIVTFANGWQQNELGTMLAMTWTNDRATALASINNLKVYDPGETAGICPFGSWGCDDTPGPSALDGPSCPADANAIYTGACLYYSPPEYDPDDKSFYHGLNCARMNDVDTNDGLHWSPDPSAISACNTTNIGGGLYYAGAQFGTEKRLDALWVVVLLTDGAANATFGTGEDLGTSPADELKFPGDIGGPEDFIDNLPFGFCPDGTWVGKPAEPFRQYCQDDDVDQVHTWNTPPPNEYNADDFARDQAKYVACYATSPAASCNGIKGQGAVIFTIGLGGEILSLDEDYIGGQKPYGASLLRYIAALGDDGDAATDQCSTEPDYEQSCGNYFFAQGGADLNRVFEMIYSRIFTRLTA